MKRHTQTLVAGATTVPKHTPADTKIELAITASKAASGHTVAARAPLDC